LTAIKPRETKIYYIYIKRIEYLSTNPTGLVNPVSSDRSPSLKSELIYVLGNANDTWFWIRVSSRMRALSDHQLRLPPLYLAKLQPLQQEESVYELKPPSELPARLGRPEAKANSEIIFMFNIK
jgi:hypothetical protein